MPKSNRIRKKSFAPPSIAFKDFKTGETISTCGYNPHVTPCCEDCNDESSSFYCPKCNHMWEYDFVKEDLDVCPECGKTDIKAVGKVYNR